MDLRVDQLANRLAQLALQLKSKRREVDLWRRADALRKNGDNLEAQLHDQLQLQAQLRSQLQQQQLQQQQQQPLQ